MRKTSNGMTSSNQRNYKQFKPLSECIEEEVVQQPVVSSSSTSAAQNPNKNTNKNTNKTQGQPPYPSDYFKIKEETLNDGKESFTDFKRRPEVKKEKNYIEIEKDVKLFDRRKSQTNLCSNESSTSNTNTNSINVNHNHEDQDRDRSYTFFRRQVTHINGEIGFAGPDVFFHTTKVRGHPGSQLKVGSVLNLKCEKVENMPFTWNAVSIYIEEPNSSSGTALPLPVPEYTNANVSLNVTREEKDPVKLNSTSKAKVPAPQPQNQFQLRNESLNFVPTSSSSRLNMNQDLDETVINSAAGQWDNMMDTIPLYIPPNLHSHPNQKEKDEPSEDNHHHHHHSKHKHKKKHKHHHHKKRRSKSTTRSSSSSRSRSKSSSSGGNSSNSRKHGHKSRSRKRNRSKSPNAPVIIPPYQNIQNPFQYQLVDPSHPNLPIQVMLVHPPSLNSMTLAPYNLNHNQVQVQRTIINQPPPPTQSVTMISSREREREPRREQTPPRNTRYEHYSPPQQKQKQLQQRRSSREKLHKTEYESKSESRKYEKYREGREDRDRALISVKPPWALFESEEKHYHNKNEHIDKLSRDAAVSELNQLAKSKKLLIQFGDASQRQVIGDSHSSGSNRRQRDKFLDRDEEDIAYDNDEYRPSSSFSYSSFRSQSNKDNPHSLSLLDRDRERYKRHQNKSQNQHKRSPSPIPPPSPPPKLSIKARLGVRSKAAENARRIITHHLNIFHESTPPPLEPEPPTFNPEQPVMRIARRRVVAPSRLHS